MQRHSLCGGEDDLRLAVRRVDVEEEAAADTARREYEQGRTGTDPGVAPDGDHSSDSCLFGGDHRCAGRLLRAVARRARVDADTDVHVPGRGLDGRGDISEPAVTNEAGTKDGLSSIDQLLDGEPAHAC